MDHVRVLSKEEVFRKAGLEEGGGCCGPEKDREADEALTGSIIQQALKRISIKKNRQTGIEG